MTVQLRLMDMTLNTPLAYRCPASEHRNTAKQVLFGHKIALKIDTKGKSLVALYRGVLGAFRWVNA